MTSVENVVVGNWCSYRLIFSPWIRFFAVGNVGIYKTLFQSSDMEISIDVPSKDNQEPTKGKL